MKLHLKNPRWMPKHLPYYAKNFSTALIDFHENIEVKVVQLS